MPRGAAARRAAPGQRDAHSVNVGVSEPTTPPASRRRRWRSCGGWPAKTDASIWPTCRLSGRTPGTALATDAAARGWADEAQRHRRLADRLYQLITHATETP